MGKLTGSAVRNERAPMGLDAGAGRPLLLVDVDGVLNLQAPPHQEQDADLDCRPYMAAGQQVLIPAGTRERLRRLAEAFEPVWATTWEHDAHPAFQEALGLGASPWPVIEMSGCARDGTWKLPPVAAALDGRWATRPAAWIDDDIGPDAFQWAARRSAAGAPTLLVVPFAHAGMTGAHAEDLLAFARANASSARGEVRQPGGRERPR